MEVSTMPIMNDFGQPMDSNEMDVDHMEIDIDLSINPETAAMVQQVDYMAEDSTAMGTDGLRDEPLSTVPAAYLDDDVAFHGNKPQKHKVYVYGLENFTTAMIESYAQEHYPSNAFKRIEWIDDSSANIIYVNYDAAAEALAAFTRHDSELSKSVTELRIAKRLSSHPSEDLQIRQAVVSDKKKAGAHEASRFYLMNPDLDPYENGTLEKRDQRRNRGQTDKGEYRRRRFDDRENKSRREASRFRADMYDEEAADEGQYSDIPAHYRQRDRGRRRRSEEDLFGGESTKGRLRNRSASPLGDGDGRLGFADDQPHRRTARPRSSTPPHLQQRAQPRELLPESNSRRELFPDKVGRRSAFDNGAVKEPRELFPTSSTSPLLSPKETFPHHTSKSKHRRTPAFDAADHINTIDRFSPRPRPLSERITGGPPPRMAVEEEFSFRGAAAAATEKFSFLGAAARNAENKIKELFPHKVNAGKELFGEKIKGRGGRRRRAEDLFDR